MSFIASAGLGAIGKGASALGVDFGNVLNPIKSIFGGGDDCTSKKRQIQKELEKALQNYTTRQQRASFIRSTGSKTSRIPATPKGMAKFFIGEDDCKHKNVSSRHQRFLDRLKPWLEKKIKQEQRAAQSNFADKAKGAPAAATAAAVGGGAGSIPVYVWVLVAVGGFYFISNQS